MKEMIKISRGLKKFHTNFIQYGVSFSKYCNYHCPYCLQNNLKHNVRDYNYELNNWSVGILNSIKTINDNEQKLNRNLPIRYHIIGGEFCIFPMHELLKPILQINNISLVDLVTNASNIDNILLLNEFLTDNNIQLRIRASLHPTQVSLKNFFDNIKVLLLNNIEVSGIECVDSKYNKVNYKLIEMLVNKLGLRFVLDQERLNGIPSGDNDLATKYEVTWSDGSTSLLKPSEINAINNANFKGWICSIKNEYWIKDIFGRDLIPYCNYDEIKGCTQFHCELCRNLLAINPSFKGKML